MSKQIIKALYIGHLLYQFITATDKHLVKKSKSIPQTAPTTMPVLLGYFNIYNDTQSLMSPMLLVHVLILYIHQCAPMKLHLNADESI